MFTDLKRSRYVVASDTLSVERSGFLGRVVFSTRSGEMLSVNQQVWDLVEAGRVDGLSDEARRRLVAANILVPEDEDELKAVISENCSAIEDNSVLYQVVQPSAWCQLDCSYCGQEHTVTQLSEADADGFLNRVRARLGAGEYRHLKIGWFGAEPLAGLSVIRTLTPRMQQLAQEFGCSYSAKIVTNGLALTPGLANELFHKHGIGDAEITLDGLAQQHDQLRFTKTGKGSFDRIFVNVKAVATTTPMRLVVRCNVGRANVDGVVPLIEKIAQEGLASSLGFYTSPIYAWGNDAHKAALRKDEYAHLEMEWLALQLRLGFKVGLVPPRRRIVCMSVQKDAEVLDAYGSSFNCTEVPYVPSYGQPNVYAIAAPERGTKSIRIYPLHNDSPAAKLHTFNDQITSGEQPECAKCAMLPVCGGQCPKAWHEQQEPCPSAKINMKSRLNVLFAMQQAVA